MIWFVRSSQGEYPRNILGWMEETVEFRQMPWGSDENSCEAKDVRILGQTEQNGPVGEGKRKRMKSGGKRQSKIML